jgi:hypothetical protein
MRILVCGGRDFSDAEMLDRELERWHKSDFGPIRQIIHGAARGADTLAGQWAERRGIPVVSYPANWAKHGRAAGPKRNAEMLEKSNPDLVVAFPGGRGTADMVRKAQDANMSYVRVE